ncbi:hypothetical protein MHY1_02009 [Methylovirgula sp. HY1]|nr:hypothetical protein MHY1_02009 [Methylovirgula sp. HY1]
MRFADLGRPVRQPGGVKLALLAFLGLAFCLSAPAQAQSPAPSSATPSTATPSATAPGTTPGPATPATPSAAPATPSRMDSENNMPGVPADASAQTLEVKARPTAILSAKAKWDAAFASIKDSQARLRAAVAKAGLKAAGHPITVFTQTDDKGFSYDAMLPLIAKPAGKTELSDTVKLGSSPSGKAIVFQHHGPYDDIDSTYDLITAYLDEKGLEAQDYFVEDYMTDLKSADDPNLAVDIYIFLK